MGFGDFVSNVFDPGDIFGYRGNKSVNAANAALDEAYGKAEDAANQNNALYRQYMDKVNNAYGGEAAKMGDRVQALEELTPYDAGPGSYTVPGVADDAEQPVASAGKCRVGYDRNRGGSRTEHIL